MTSGTRPWNGARYVPVSTATPSLFSSACTAFLVGPLTVRWRRLPVRGSLPTLTPRAPHTTRPSCSSSFLIVITADQSPSVVITGRLYRSIAALLVSLDTRSSVHGPVFTSNDRPNPTHCPAIRCPDGSTSIWIAPE